MRARAGVRIVLRTLQNVVRKTGDARRTERLAAGDDSRSHSVRQPIERKPAAVHCQLSHTVCARTDRAATSPYISLALELVEEVVDADRFARRNRAIVDPLAQGNVEHAEPERREIDRPRTVDLP